MILSNGNGFQRESNVEHVRDLEVLTLSVRVLSIRSHSYSRQIFECGMVLGGGERVGALVDCPKHVLWGL